MTTPSQEAIEAAPVVQITQELKRRLDEADTNGLHEYSATVDRTDLSAQAWADHLVGELLDGAKYALALKRETTALRRELEQIKAELKKDEDNCPKCGCGLRYCGPQDPATHVPAVECRLCQLSAERDTAQADCAALRLALSNSNAWILANTTTNVHDLVRLNTETMNAAHPGSELLADRERLEALDALMQDGDEIVIWIEDGGVIISKCAHMLHESPEPSLRAAIDATRKPQP